MLHTEENQLYRFLWALLPIGLAVGVLTIPNLQKDAIAYITVEAIQNEDHLFEAGEEIVCGFQTDDLKREQLTAQWNFGDTLLIMGHDVEHMDSFILEPRVIWVPNDSNSLNMDVVVVYDTVPVQTGPRWILTNHLVDSVARVKFMTPGEYKIRLKLTSPEASEPVVLFKQIEIMPRRSRPPVDSFPEIIGPKEGLVGEDLVFTCKGRDVEFWYWKFGDGKHHDREDLGQVVYAYEKEGTYTVRLKTNLSEDWITHKVKINPTWNVDSIPEFIDSTLIIQNWLKIHLQRIADTPFDDPDNFYKEKKLIENSYLSSRLKPIPVFVNEEELPTDFDAYCQQIHMLGGQLEILGVTFSWDGDSTYQRIKVLNVSQKRVRQLVEAEEEPEPAK